jgi:hypothetical protein
LVHRLNGKKASMVAAICYGVRGGGAQLAFHVPAGNYDSDTLSEVLGSCRYGDWSRGPTRVTTGRHCRPRVPSPG